MPYISNWNIKFIEINFTRNNISMGNFLFKNIVQINRKTQCDPGYDSLIIILLKTCFVCKGKEINHKDRNM